MRGLTSSATTLCLCLVLRAPFLFCARVPFPLPFLPLNLRFSPFRRRSASALSNYELKNEGADCREQRL